MRNLKNKRLIKSLALVLAICVIVLVGKFFTDQNSVNEVGEDFVVILDADQGDSILICSNGQAALIDTGKKINSRTLLTQIRSYGVKNLDALIISHSHDDHAGGAEYILKNIETQNIIIPEFKNDEDVEELNSAMVKSGAEIFTATEGMVINIGDFEFTVLYADNDDSDINNRSLIIIADIEGKKFLFTGDAEVKAEKVLIENGINFDCDVLKVGHHGSRTSSSQEFLDIATPEFAVISVGEDNSYGLPSEDVIKKLENIGAEVIRTDYVGDVVFGIENGQIIRGQ